MGGQMKLSVIPKGVRIYCRMCKTGKCDKCIGTVKPDIYRIYPCNCKHPKTKREDFARNEVALVSHLNTIFQF